MYYYNIDSAVVSIIEITKHNVFLGNYRNDLKSNSLNILALKIFTYVKYLQKMYRKSQNTLKFEKLSKLKYQFLCRKS